MTNKCQETIKVANKILNDACNAVMRLGEISGHICKSRRQYKKKRKEPEGKRADIKDTDKIRSESKVPKGKPDIFERDKYIYMIVDKTGGKRTRRIIPADEVDEVVPTYLRKVYLEAKCKLLSNNIKALNRLLKDYKEVTFENIKEYIPKHLQRFPEELFLNSDEFSDPWELEPYEKSNYKPEERKHLTTRGLKVRSKSEVSLAELLYTLSLPLRYEQIVRIGGINYIPDFTVKGPDGKIWYIEHCGLTNNQEYIEHHYKKLAAYARAGIVPWRNLIVTYEDEEGGLDLLAIKQELESKILSYA